MFFESNSFLNEKKMNIIIWACKNEPSLDYYHVPSNAVAKCNCYELFMEEGAHEGTGPSEVLMWHGSWAWWTLVGKWEKVGFEGSSSRQNIPSSPFIRKRGLYLTKAWLSKPIITFGLKILKCLWVCGNCAGKLSMELIRLLVSHQTKNLFKLEAHPPPPPTSLSLSLNSPTLLSFNWTNLNCDFFPLPKRGHIVAKAC